MTPFPAPNRLHVWWARRPLVASRAAVLASLLPADADRGQVQARARDSRQSGGYTAIRIDTARRQGPSASGGQAVQLSNGRSSYVARTRLDRTVAANHDGHARAVTTHHGPRSDCRRRKHSLRGVADSVLESVANDLNPVSVTDHEVPRSSGPRRVRARHSVNGIRRAGRKRWRRRVERRTSRTVLPAGTVTSNAIPSMTYLWARTVICPYCDGLVPLSPNWRLAPDGTGVTPSA